MSLDIPPLWFVEIEAKSASILMIRDVPSEISALRLELNTMTTLFAHKTWSQDRLYSSLALFLFHLQRRLNIPDLISHLLQTRYSPLS